MTYALVIETLTTLNKNSRYLRINPQYWNGWPCLRTEFLGCSAGEGKCHVIL